jgi:HSP20 family protein
MGRFEDETWHLPALRGEVDTLFSEFLGLRPRRGDPLAFWNPHLDLLEEEERYVLEMDLPGVRREDVRVEVGDRAMAVSGRREIVRETGGPRVRQRERYFGSFRRTVTLPGPVERDRVTLALEDGILRVELPKRRAQR